MEKINGGQWQQKEITWYVSSNYENWIYENCVIDVAKISSDA